MRAYANVRRAGEVIVLTSPEVGLWREPPKRGQILQPGELLGRIEQLGQLIEVEVPSGAMGRVVEVEEEHGRAAVGYGTSLVVLDPRSAGVEPTARNGESDAEGSFEEAALVLRAPMGGRLFLRPGPDKPAFVTEGDTVKDGQTVALIEVMKTFNRVVYGDGLPSPARVKTILVEDGADVTGGDVLLSVEEI